jgi:O-antigen/teichoic acid export membrane protein
MPFVVRGLGVERFGILVLAWGLLGYLNIFDLGLSRAATKFLAEALGRGQPEAVPGIIWSAVIAQTGLGVIGGLVLAAITPFLVGQVLKIPHELADEAALSFDVLAACLPIVLVAGSFRGLLEAGQRFDLVNAVRTPSSTAVYLSPFIGLLLGWDLPRMVGLLFASRGLDLAAHYWLCARLFRLTNGNYRLSLSSFRALVRFGGWVTVSSVVGPILVYLDRFIIGALSTLAAVSYYSAPYEMVTRLWLIPASLVATLFPAFSALAGLGQEERIVALASRAVKYLLLIVGSLVVLVLTYAREILELWLGAEFARESTMVLQVLAVGVLINTLAHVPFFLVQALGRPDLTAKFHLVELPFYVLIVWGLVSAWGINGAALAWSVRVTVDALLLFVAAARFASLSPRVFLANRVPEVSLLLGILIALGVGVNAAGVDPWVRLPVPALACGCAGLIAWRFSLSESERTQLIGLLGIPVRK